MPYYGVPVVSQQGRGGGVELLPHYRTDLTGLTERDFDQAVFERQIGQTVRFINQEQRRTHWS